MGIVIEKGGRERKEGEDPLDPPAEKFPRYATDTRRPLKEQSVGTLCMRLFMSVAPVSRSQVYTKRQKQPRRSTSGAAYIIQRLTYLFTILIFTSHYVRPLYNGLLARSYPCTRCNRTGPTVVLCSSNLVDTPPIVNVNPSVSLSRLTQ